ncbi:hypothetical protein [Fodinicola feengrottensis]|nr:hypothetical protein [Fodinicola feengrottensis]
MIVPPAAGVMSAVGFLTAPMAFDFARSAGGPADRFPPSGRGRDLHVDAL